MKRWLFYKIVQTRAVVRKIHYSWKKWVCGKLGHVPGPSHTFTDKTNKDGLTLPDTMFHCNRCLQYCRFYLCPNCGAKKAERIVLQNGDSDKKRQGIEVMPFFSKRALKCPDCGKLTVMEKI